MNCIKLLELDSGHYWFESNLMYPINYQKNH